MNLCPRCEAKGRAIEPVTLEAQVLPDRLALLADLDGWRLCTSGDCEVVYFRGDTGVVLRETRAVPFHKNEDPQRLVCFCFEHSVAELEADVAANGTSTIQASIKAACKEGQDDCERKNPQGRCCLGNVGKVVKRGTLAGSDGASATDCCGVEAPADEAASCGASKSAVSVEPATTAHTSARSGLFASGGAFVAAVLSSACCWLPLAAIGLGASSAGMGAFFEAWRVPLLLATVALLGVGFYLVYRKPRCAPGEACEVPNPRLQRFNRGMLWLTTVLVAAFAFFPEYIGAFTGGGEVAMAAPMQTTVHYRVEGMTCAGCEGHAREAIEAIPGVVSVAVSYRDSSAEVVWSGRPDDAAIASAIAEFGYRSNPLR